jgi:cyclopropane fatty-acyl-phospholipid synthase-like methyltransferase
MLENNPVAARYRTTLNAAMANLIMARDAAQRQASRAAKDMHSQTFQLCTMKTRAFQEAIDLLQTELTMADKAVAGL